MVYQEEQPGRLNEGEQIEFVNILINEARQSEKIDGRQLQGIKKRLRIDLLRQVLPLRVGNIDDLIVFLNPDNSFVRVAEHTIRLVVFVGARDSTYWSENGKGAVSSNFVNELVEKAVRSGALQFQGELPKGRNEFMISRGAPAGARS